MSGYCVADPVSGPVITIAAAGASGGSCSVSPASITVAPDAVFSFDNDDSVEHVITGADGQTWTTVKPAQPSAYVGITRAGTWSYVVSGCASGGTVVVQ
jgi:plastocyanin